MALYLTPHHIQALESLIEYIFKNKRLLDKAMESAGATSAQGDNRDLAHVGDPAIRLVYHLDGYNHNSSRGNHRS